MKITCFEDIIAWQKSRSLVSKIYAVSEKGMFGKDWGLRDQIRRSVLSIPANIAEGFARSGNREFARFLSISNGSLSETKSHLYIALDLKYISQPQFNSFVDDLNEIQRMIKAFEDYLKTRF
ncbi:MAG: four helix bundle protein [Phycisphaerae bacterium]|jgi:four helix bundle protein|nr:four helix bundle protein [Phycisphaerae bacterium]